MFSGELRKLLIEVITSWQVLVVTGVLVVYIFLVNYVARIYHRRPSRNYGPEPGPEIIDEPGPMDTKDLNLEEESSDGE